MKTVVLVSRKQAKLASRAIEEIASIRKELKQTTDNRWETFWYDDSNEENDELIDKIENIFDSYGVTEYSVNEIETYKNN